MKMMAGTRTSVGKSGWAIIFRIVEPTALALRDSTMTKLCGGKAAPIWDEAMRREPDPAVLRKAIDDLDAAWAHW